MNRKTIGILIIVAGLIILALIVYVIFFHNFNQPAPGTASNLATSTQSKPVATSTAQPKQILNVKTYTPEELSKDELVRLASSFAERYGSYSNQANYQNMQDLKIFMTASFEKATDESVRQLAAKNIDHSAYYGITAKAVSNNVTQFDDQAGIAKIVISTQRRESAANNSTVAYPQDIVISFIKEAGVWKVDSAVWQPKQ